MDCYTSFILFIFLLIIILLVRISYMSTGILFPSFDGIFWKIMLSGFIFCVFIGFFTGLLYLLSGCHPEAKEGIGFIFYFLGFPTTFIITFFNSFINWEINITISFLFVCMMINCSFIGLIIYFANYFLK